MRHASAAYDVTVRGRLEPHLLSRVVRILAWQGVTPDDFRFKTFCGMDVKIGITARCDAWRVTRLVVNLRKIHGVVTVEALDTNTAESANRLSLPSPVAR